MSLFINAPKNAYANVVIDFFLALFFSYRHLAVLTFRTSRRRYFGNFPRPDCLSDNGTIGAQWHLEQSQYLAL